MFIFIVFNFLYFDFDFLFFVPALLLSILTPIFLYLLLVSLSYFILAVPCVGVWGKHLVPHFLLPF